VGPAEAILRKVANWQNFVLGAVDVKMLEGPVLHILTTLASPRSEVYD
jgi:hypothetical protein